MINAVKQVILIKKRPGCDLMRDRHFMEDENELSYLLWETRDDNRRTSRSSQWNLILKTYHLKNFRHM